MEPHSDCRCVLHVIHHCPLTGPPRLFSPVCLTDSYANEKRQEIISLKSLGVAPGRGSKCNQALGGTAGKRVNLCQEMSASHLGLIRGINGGVRCGCGRSGFLVDGIMMMVRHSWTCDGQNAGRKWKNEAFSATGSNRMVKACEEEPQRYFVSFNAPGTRVAKKAI